MEGHGVLHPRVTGQGGGMPLLKDLGAEMMQDNGGRLDSYWVQ